MKSLIQILLVVATVLICVQIMIHDKHYKHSSFGHSHDGSVFSIDFYAYASRLHSWNPRFKALFSMVCLVCCIVCNNVYVSCAVILLMTYITVVIGGCR